MNSIFVLALISICFFNFHSINCFEDITSKIFFENNDGILAAFGDFDSNTKLDIFIIQDDKKSVTVLNATADIPYFQNSTIKCTLKQSITSVVPGDFNGDAQMDILVTTKNDDKSTNVIIQWGRNSQLDCNERVIATITDQPLILDYNGDMIIDFLGEVENEGIYVWLGSVTKNFTKVELGLSINNDSQSLLIPHSSAFIDMNSDLVSDILLTGHEKIQVWLNQDGYYNLSFDIKYPNGIKHFGQLTFVDLDGNGKVDILLPVCNDSECLHSYILGLNKESLDWELVCDNFTSGNFSYGFKVPDDKFPEISQISLKSADIDMDGYPDLIAVLELKKYTSTEKGIHKSTKLILFKNEPCHSSSCFLDRELVPYWDMPGLVDLNNVYLAAFYDLYDDGIIDLLALTKDDGMWKIHALLNMINYDACFIKVLVLTGRCFADCPNEKSVSYGTNQPGPMIIYETLKPNGELKTGLAAQLHQSAYFALQLPYCLFGLGQTPNFVEKLTVSLPINSTIKRKREWTQIIPNSQIVIVPYPPNKPSKWVNKLFVTPSHLVIMTGVALMGTCGIILLIIGFLHFNEKSEDKRERLQEAHRFNFDAM